MKKKLLPLLTVLIGFILFPMASCEDGSAPVLLFSVEDDIRLGRETAQAIANDPATYPILSESQYPDSYNYLRGILSKILSASEVEYRDRFMYQEIKIIQDDNVLNAFATPGGYIYVYTGLIKFLNSEDQFAGVLGHEVAHAERRHSSRQLQKQLGVQFLLDIALGGNSETIGQVLNTLASLKFSRDDEYEADEYSVIYLSDTEYQCNGVGGFFEQMEGQGGVPEFLSTHPNPGNRVEEINEKANEIDCDTAPSGITTYADFIASLP